MSIKQMAKVWEWSKAEGAALLVMLALADHADDDGYCFPGVERVAKKCRISSRSVQRHVKDLGEIGELKVETGRGVTVQGGATNRYKITLVHASPHMPLQSGDNLAPGDKTTEVVTPRARSGDTVMSPKPSEEPSDITPPTPKGGKVRLKLTEEQALSFADFWEAYPRRTGRADAEVAFVKNGAFDLIEHVISAIEAHKKTEQWQRGIYPHPATWLNGRRWEDDLTHEQQRHKSTNSRRPEVRGGETNSKNSDQYAGLGRIH